MAHSRLRSVLSERQMNVPDLGRKLRDEGVRVNIKTLYQLAQESRSLGRVDVQLVESICHVLDVPLTDIIDIRPVRLQRFAAEKQQRLDALMELSNTGQLLPAQRTELGELVYEAEAVALANAQALGQRKRPSRRH